MSSISDPGRRFTSRGRGSCCCRCVSRAHPCRGSYSVGYAWRSRRVCTTPSTNTLAPSSGSSDRGHREASSLRRRGRTTLPGYRGRSRAASGTGGQFLHLSILMPGGSSGSDCCIVATTLDNDVLIRLFPFRSSHIRNDINPSRPDHRSPHHLPVVRPEHGEEMVAPLHDHSSPQQPPPVPVLKIHAPKRRKGTKKTAREINDGYRG